MKDSVYWLTVAMALFPLSFVIILWGADNKIENAIIWGIILFLLSASFWIIAVKKMNKEKKDEKVSDDKLREKQDELQRIHDEQQRINNEQQNINLKNQLALYEELKKMGQELDERDNRPTPKPKL
jgi:hypothetical protein